MKRVNEGKITWSAKTLRVFFVSIYIIEKIVHKSTLFYLRINNKLTSIVFGYIDNKYIFKVFGQILLIKGTFDFKWYCSNLTKWDDTSPKIIKKVIYTYPSRKCHAVTTLEKHLYLVPRMVCDFLPVSWNVLNYLLISNNIHHQTCGKATIT